jgi:hypothetical protein
MFEKETIWEFSYPSFVKKKIQFFLINLVGRGDQHQIVRPTLRDSYRTEDNAHKPHIHFLPLPICVLLLSAKIIIDREDRASLGVPLSLIPAIGGQGREGSSFLLACHVCCCSLGRQ